MRCETRERGTEDRRERQREKRAAQIFLYNENTSIDIKMFRIYKLDWPLLLIKYEARDEIKKHVKWKPLCCAHITGDHLPSYYPPQSLTTAIVSTIC